MLGRFVILHHQLEVGEHWDLMLEHGDVLLTWQLPLEPVGVSALPMTAKRIADHRRIYLDYEGPISGGRGHVRRVDAGTVIFEQITVTHYVVALRGRRFNGRIQLVDDGAHWLIDVLPA